MTYLLDINVLVALFDSMHRHHEAAHRWFDAEGKRSWATCPLTENGFVRVMSNPAYPTVSATPAEVADRLRIFWRHPGHAFWPDSVSIRDQALFDMGRVTGHGQITDLYLAGLAATQGGKLATFDSSIAADALIPAHDHIVVLIPRANTH